MKKIIILLSTLIYLVLLFQICSFAEDSIETTFTESENIITESSAHNKAVITSNAVVTSEEKQEPTKIQESESATNSESQETETKYYKYYTIGELGDSVDVDPNEVEIFKQSDSDRVIKLYGLSFMHLFAEGADIESFKVHEELNMVISPFNGIRYMRMRNGNLEHVTISVSDWSEFYKYAVYPERVFGAFTEVYNVYCLNGDASHDGVYIYYVTDKGDYVLYKEFLSSNEQFLFPVEDFYVYAKDVWELRLSQADRDGGGMPELSEDILNYQDNYKFVSYDWIFYVVISVALVVGVSAGVIFLKKRKVKNSGGGDN